MNLRSVLTLLVFGLGTLAHAQVELEKSAPPAPGPQPTLQPAPAPAPAQPAPAPAPTSAPPATPQAAPAPAPFSMPPPPEPPAARSPIGLLILAVILAHVCLPLGVVIGVLLLFLIVRFFRGGLMKLAMGLAASGGAARAIKGVLVVVGSLIVFPSGFLGLNWAAGWMDYPVSGGTYWVYGIVVSVLTGFVFVAVAKTIGRALKKSLAGRMGMMGGMRGMGGGFEGFAGFGGMGDNSRDLRDRKGKKKRRL